MSFGIPARRVRWLFIAAVLIAMLGSACSSAVTAPEYPAAAGVTAVDLAWRPREGMHIVHRVTTDVDASGPLTEPIPAENRKRRIVLTRTFDVVAVRADSFDVRFSEDGVMLPATLRFSRNWEPLEVVRDGTGPVSDKDRGEMDAAMRQFARPYTQAAPFFRHWNVGDSQPFDIQLSGMTDATGSGGGTMTFRRVVVIDGRQAAEFDWEAATEFLAVGEPGRGAPGRMKIAGREWRDLATGASLRLTATATAEFTRQGRPTRVEYRTDEVLDQGASRL